ncbi:hypothetical protein D3871_23090 [Noviherbaspirillum saxi]|uniref:ArgK protein n=1 Tax=Noviherbaspirillum saxi TaxID=2320863 RepID=A0A3A3FLM1_9BURK|nr:hypothetical protein D3871_23090 [Noviherbaspirillum saxi]
MSSRAFLSATEDASVAALVAGVRASEPRALAKTITLAESTRADHRARAQRVLGDLLPHTGRSIRVGITGVPGVGKSTFIEALGLHLLEQGTGAASWIGNAGVRRWTGCGS